MAIVLFGIIPKETLFEDGDQLISVPLITTSPTHPPLKLKNPAFVASWQLKSLAA
jgi:hypothetical protein